MIEPKELRIGNIVSGKNDPPMCVAHITEADVELRFPGEGESYGDWYYTTEELRPIPLTEEWLLKLGFEQGGYDFMEFWIGDFHLMGGDIEPGDGSFAYNYCLYTPGLGENKHKQIEVTAVHQLQNLYYALAGKELEIKSPHF